MAPAAFVVVFFFGGFVYMMGSSPTDSKSEAVEIGHGKLSVTQGSSQKKIYSFIPGHNFADVMVSKLSRSEPFTIFAPSDEALLRMSSIFKDYDHNKGKVDTILGRLFGYCSVARRLPASALAVNGPERLESVEGFPLIVSRTNITHPDGSVRQYLVVNEERVEQEDLSYGTIIVHLMGYGLGPDEFLSAIQETDPEAVKLGVASDTEFGDPAISGGQGTRKEERQQHRTSSSSEDVSSSSLRALGLDGDRKVESQNARVLQELKDTDEEKAVDVAPDLEAQAGKETGSAQERKDSVSESAKSRAAQAVQKATVAAVAEKLKKGSGVKDETTVVTGAVSNSVDSDTRNRDTFVKEGPGLLEAPGQSGGDQREEEEASSASGTGDQGTRALLEAQKAAGGAGWGKQEFGLSGIGWWHRKVQGSEKDKLSDSDQSGGGAAGLGFGWLGFGGHASGADGSDKDNGTTFVDGSKNDRTVGVDAADSLVLNPDPVDNLPKLLKHPEVGEGDQGQGMNKTGVGKPQGTTGVAVDIRGGLATSRTSGNGSQPAPAESSRPPEFCNSRGFLNKEGLCRCSVLFAGPDCEKIADTSKLAIDPYVGPLAWSSPAVAHKAPRKGPQASGNRQEDSKGASGPSRQPQHLHAMTMRLLEELGKEEREELQGLLPQYDPLASTAWESCAVVGNSGGLLLRDDGKEIDRHAMVLRFNAAPTMGYEKQVGSKTTLRLSEVDWVGFAERNETVMYHLWLRAQRDELRHLLRFKHVFPDSPLLTVLDLGFSAQILSTLGTIPSTGLVGISFALQKCRRVDLYGFGLSEKHGVRHHYFNRNTSVKGVEKGVDGLDKEFDALLDLADAELLWVADPCLYDCRRSMQKCSMCMRVPIDELTERTDWTEEQAMLNAKRELRWRKFMTWQGIEKEMQFKKQSMDMKRKSLARRNRTAAHSKKDDEEDDKARQADLVDWGKLIEEERLEELPLSILLTYFRTHQVTIPDTKKQMLLAVKNHYYFSHGQLHKQTNRLYRASD